MTVKYAIKLPFDDGHILVIDMDRFSFEGPDYPKLYDTIEEATEAASIWNKFEIVEYDESNIPDEA